VKFANGYYELIGYALDYADQAGKKLGYYDNLA